ncbi:MAG: 4-hydroxy-tetrahydrodipicolinate reductase [Dictyoglomus thermophilum]|nr:4-hydroxy-tetrahydrodipicolinate reductase [Dictyoglomus thermophilum]MCX7721018.1 4-hydroxy-tetrahydrodipicolinate reductase [Dictyoglomus thermophilum]
MIKTVLFGACGKMGRVIGKALIDAVDIELVGAIDPYFKGEKYEKIIGTDKISLEVLGSVEELKKDFDVAVDFTNAEAAYQNIKKILQMGKRMVVGTTGLTQEMINEFKDLALKNNTAILIAPNFALGAVLMIQLAKQVVKYFPDVEIIELHHNEKADAPSGTAILTAEILSEEMKKHNLTHKDATKIEKLPGSRGGKLDSINIHSVRLPGLVAHQEIIFGGLGQTLSIRHDALSRECYIPGVLMAIREIIKREGFFYGLESFLNREEA